MRQSKTFERSAKQQLLTVNSTLSMPRPFRSSSTLSIKNRDRRVHEEGTRLVEDTLRRKQEEERRKEAKAAKKRLRRQLVPKHQPSTPQVPTPPSLFPGRYERGELPCTIEHGGAFNRLTWVCPLEHLDYAFYLPLFFDGIRLTENPPAFIAEKGVEDLLEASRGHPDWILPSLPDLAKPLKYAFMTGIPSVVLKTLRVIRLLLSSNEGVGEALVPYYKLFLSPIKLWLDYRKDTGDVIDYSQRQSNDVGEEALSTLELMERTGGPNAYVNIKFFIPTYESCVA